MERIPVGGGRFMIEMSPEEIQELNRCTEMSQHLGLIASLVMRKESAVNPEEIRELNNEIKTHIETVRLMLKPSDH